MMKLSSLFVVLSSLFLTHSDQSSYLGSALEKQTNASAFLHQSLDIPNPGYLLQEGKLRFAFIIGRSGNGKRYITDVCCR